MRNDLKEFEASWKRQNHSEFLGIIFTIGILVIGVIMIAAGAVGCREAERVNYNISREADNFNIIRRVTVIDCFTGDVLFQMSGKMAIKADRDDNQLEIVVSDNGKYQKHIIGLSDNVTYVVEDLNIGENDVSSYRYTIIYNPKMWLPVEVKNGL